MTEETEKESEKILVVDDEELTLSSLEAILKHKGYDVICAENGPKALEIIKKEPVAVIICDQNLPGMKGVEVLRESIKLQPDAIRISLTGVSDLDTLTDLVNVGQIAQFIPKPWDNAFLLKTVQNSLDKVRLIRENRRLHKELEKNHKNLEREIKLGGQIQNIMLFGKIPTDLPGLEIDAISLPSRAIDGDFFDFFRPSHECLDLVVADVMGKGLPAALVGTAVKNQLIRFAVPNVEVKKYTKKAGWYPNISTLNEIMTHVQNEIVSHLINLEYFVCLSYGRFDMKKRTLSYIDCGSTKPLVYHAKEKRISLITGSNYPLGMVSLDTFHTIEIPFDHNDLFIFYSDGLTEATSPSGEIYGDERLHKIIQEVAIDHTPSEILQTLTERLMQFTKKTFFDDDLTIIIVKILSDQPIRQRVENNSAKFRNDLSQLQAVRDFVGRFCRDVPQADGNYVQQMQLVIDEIFANIVEHGYESGEQGSILIQAESDKEGVSFHIFDQGKAFDPAEIQEPSLAGDKYCGFGLYMIKQIADTIIYQQKQSNDGWNHLCISKSFLSEVCMKLSHEQVNNILAVTLEGTSLDAKESQQFKQEILDLIRSNHIQNVVLDLHNLNFIDSSGLGSFLSILRKLNEDGGELKMASMNRSIRIVFELVCMHKIFEIYNSKDEAIRSFVRK